MGGATFGYGLRMLLDGHQRFTRNAAHVYLRVKDYIEQPGLNTDGTYGDALELGVPFSPTGAASVDTGYTDIEIIPRPAYVPGPKKDEGEFGAKLLFGWGFFFISHTFVRQQAIQLQLPVGQSKEVFRDRGGPPNGKCIGLAYNGLLWEIESYDTYYAGGEIIKWKLRCNAISELVYTQNPSEI